MRRFTAVALVLLMVISLCACGKKDNKDTERSCGVYIKMEADDVYTVSCGTDVGSDSFEAADKAAIAPGTEIHFDFAGKKADSTEKAEIEYSICIYDKELNVISVKSFVDDFSNHARVDITVTADHKIINANAGSCGGDVVVEMESASAEDGVTYMLPKVTMPSRVEAAEAMNTAITAMTERFTGESYTANREQYVKNIGDGTAEGLSAFSMDRTVRAERADSEAVSLRVVDRVSLGTTNTLTISGHSFDSQTGAELKLADLGDSAEKIINAVAENILVSFNGDEYKDVFFNEGYSSALRSLVADGHWYLSAEGMVIIANPGELAAVENGFYEFTVGYDELKDVIDSRFIPVQHEGGEGDVSITFASDTNDSDLTILAEAAATDIKSMLISASGTIFDLSAYYIDYVSDDNFNVTRQILGCSDMSDGAALALNTELQGTTPSIAVLFSLADGTKEVRFLSLDDAGGLKVTNPNGAVGTIITERLPYTGDLNGDGIDESISAAENAEGLCVISVSSNKSSSEVTTAVKSVNSIRLFDINGDGSREIYVDGTDANGDAITCALFYSPEAAQPLQAASFDGQGFAYGHVNDFESSSLVLNTVVNILGTYNVRSIYSLSDMSFTKNSGDLVFDNNTTFVTTTKSITLANGSLLKVGTSLRFTSTDGSSVINFVTDGGFTGSISITNDGSGWKIGGQPDTSYFSSLPYQS